MAVHNIPPVQKSNHAWEIFKRSTAIARTWTAHTWKLVKHTKNFKRCKPNPTKYKFCGNMGWICFFQIVHMSSATLIWSCVARNNRSSYLSSSSWATLSLVSPHISYFVQLFITLSNLAFAFLVYTASCDNWNRGINLASSVHRLCETSHLVPKVHSWFHSNREELKKARSQDRAKKQWSQH